MRYPFPFPLQYLNSLSSSFTITCIHHPFPPLIISVAGAQTLSPTLPIRSTHEGLRSATPTTKLQTGIASLGCGRGSLKSITDRWKPALLGCARDCCSLDSASFSITDIPHNTRRAKPVAEILHRTTAVRIEVARSPHPLPSYRRALPLWVVGGGLSRVSPIVGNRRSLGYSLNTTKPGRVGSLCLVARGIHFSSHNLHFPFTAYSMTNR
ncbi:hypothetical protein FJTKL_07428 [Diaporthe vaccinii]|uniref:Uncharacterized protein n=1 Tax=Diaporthe vaccinii TaxID=105482 RepID=A0ABR4EU15_9PEZI